MTPRPRFHFVCPGALDQPTGGYRYDRKILETLARAGVPVDCHELPGRFPLADDAARAAAAQLWDGLGAAETVVIDGLALPAFADVIGRRADGPRLVVLVHHPLHLETGLAPETAARLRTQEEALLAGADVVLVTSPATGEQVRTLGVAVERIEVVIPGTDRGTAMVRPENGIPSLLCVAALIPRKGHLLLISALSALRHLPWHLCCAGPIDRDRETAAAVSEAIDAAGLSDRVALVGALSEADLAARYASADLFVLASLYEGYGMAFAEALAHGLPVVASGAGAVRDTVPEDAGLVIPAGDRSCLVAALAMTLSDRMLRARLAKGAAAAARALPDWETQAARFLEAVGA